jgi:sugar phosphate isomerase/epimerase
MRYVYFTKLLEKLDVPALIAFCQETGLDGVDLAVRPGYPVTPDNVAAELPRAVKRFQDEKLTVGLVTAPTSLADAEGNQAKALFEACGKAGVPAIKIGYFTWKEKFDATLADAHSRLAGFARLAEKTGVKCCYHTHSGNFIGNNAACLRLLLQDLDPHHVGVFIDTGHVAVNGGPIQMELDIIRNWLHLVAIKDMAWQKSGDDWSAHVVPAGQGIVRWNEVAQGLKNCRYNGTISLHGEYETKDLEERKQLARAEVEFLRKKLG